MFLYLICLLLQFLVTMHISVDGSETAVLSYICMVGFSTFLLFIMQVCKSAYVCGHKEIKGLEIYEYAELVCATIWVVSFSILSLGSLWIRLALYDIEGYVKFIPEVPYAGFKTAAALFLLSGAVLLGKLGGTVVYREREAYKNKKAKESATDITEEELKVNEQ